MRPKSLLVLRKKLYKSTGYIPKNVQRQWQNKLNSKQADVDRQEQKNKEQAYSIHKSIFSETFCKSDLIKEFGKDHWLEFIGKMYELGKEIGKSQLEVKIDLDCYLIGIYRCFGMYEEAYEILCVQAEHSSWLNQYILEDVVKQSGHWFKLKGILEKRVYEGKDYRECLDKLKSMGYQEGYLYITVSHKTAEEMADRFNFNADQRQQLSELLVEENRSMWSAVLYGIYSGDDAIVTVALSQIGNVGGQPYWSWYGFNSRVEWCACFVSWCANECGYIDSGVIPKFAGCVNGVQWFKDRGQWQDGSFEPSAGQIIFFDWDNKGSSGPQDGQSDHVGIVEKCENGIVYTIEGNSGDSCRQRQYPVGYYEILGYGIPEQIKKSTKNHI